MRIQTLNMVTGMRLRTLTIKENILYGKFTMCKYLISLSATIKYLFHVYCIETKRNAHTHLKSKE